MKQEFEEKPETEKKETPTGTPTGQFEEPKPDKDKKI